MDLSPLTDDEAAILYTVGRFGSDGYPIRRCGRRWFVGPFRSWRGFPCAYATKREALAAFHRWEDLALERWRETKEPEQILTGVGVRPERVS
jgi:hypothetical protein